MDCIELTKSRPRRWRKNPVNCLYLPTQPSPPSPPEGQPTPTNPPTHPPLLLNNTLPISGVKVSNGLVGYYFNCRQPCTCNLCISVKQKKSILIVPIISSATIKLCSETWSLITHKIGWILGFFHIANCNPIPLAAPNGILPPVWWRERDLVRTNIVPQGSP